MPTPSIFAIEERADGSGGRSNHSEFAIVKRWTDRPTVDYVFGVEVPKLTSEPTAPEAGGGGLDHR